MSTAPQLPRPRYSLSQVYDAYHTARCPKDAAAWFSVFAASQPPEVAMDTERYLFSHQLNPTEPYLNAALVFTRSIRNALQYRGLFTSKTITEINCLGDGTYLAPLYIFSEPKEPKVTVRENLNTAHRLWINDMWPNDYVTLKELVCYLYALGYNVPYVTKYRSLLTTDFPCFPYLKDIDTVRHLTTLGNDLMELHLMTDTALSYYRLNDRDTGAPPYPNSPIYIPKSSWYDPSTCRLTVASDWQIHYIPPEIYNYTLGQHRVLHKWLRSYAGDQLTEPMYLHILEMIYVIEASIAIEKEISSIDVTKLPTVPTPSPKQQRIYTKEAKKKDAKNTDLLGGLFSF